MASETFRPAFLLWFDLETTSLDPKEDLILEVAWILTHFEFPYFEVGRGHHIIDQSDLPAWLDGGKVDPFVVKMHATSGLFRAFSDPNVAKTPLAKVEEILLGISEGWPLDKNSKVAMAGHSVGNFDLQFVRAQLPRFAKRLSHRVFDVSAISLHARSLGMPPVPRVERHRSLEDVMEALSHVRACTKWLLSLDAVVQAGREIKEGAT